MFKVGEFEIDESKIASAVTLRLLQRATAHILNNECAANVLNKTKRAIVGKDGKPDSVTDHMLASWRDQDVNRQQIEAWENEYCLGKIAAMYDGTLSVRVASGPVRDPLVAAMRNIAKAEVVGVLKANGAKFPKADETIMIGDQELDGDTLIDRRLGHAEHGPRITKLAERQVADAKRLREATAKTVAAESGGLAASLGL